MGGCFLSYLSICVCVCVCSFFCSFFLRFFDPFFFRWPRVCLLRAFASQHFQIEQIPRPDAPRHRLRHPNRSPRTCSVAPESRGKSPGRAAQPQEARHEGQGSERKACLVRFRNWVAGSVRECPENLTFQLGPVKTPPLPADLDHFASKASRFLDVPFEGH